VLRVLRLKSPNPAKYSVAGQYFSVFWLPNSDMAKRIAKAGKEKQPPGTLK
jgi:hypothetical protein